MGPRGGGENGYKVTIRSLLNQNGCEVLEPKQMCVIFQQYFAQLLGTKNRLDNRTNFHVYLDGLPRLSASEAECCKRPITSAEILEAMKSCVRGRSLGLDDLRYEFYISMPDLFRGSLSRRCTAAGRKMGEYPQQCHYLSVEG